MKKYYLLIMMLFTFNLFSQSSGWSPVERITNSKTQDRHPSLPDKDMFYRYLGFSSELVFDRTDSIGTNICVIKCVSGNWSNEVKYLTSGKGIKEYPTVGDSLIVFHNQNEKCSNLFYCHYINNGWSEPVQLTFDTNKYNLYPKIYTFPSEWTSLKLMTWEKDKKIYFMAYNYSKWGNEKQISPNDTFEYSNPVISFDGKYAIAFEKKINENNIHIMLAHTDGEIVTVDTVYTTGINRNPKFVNGWGKYITWENKIRSNWQIIRRKTDNIGPWHVYLTYLSDSIYNYNQFIGFFIDMPLVQSIKSYLNTNIDNNFVSLFFNCLYIKSNSNSRTLILDGTTTLNTNHKTGKNGAISRFRAVGGNRVWAVWETEEDGYTNLYGSYENLFPTKAEEYSRPFEFSLNQNYPNPFNPSTVISYSVGAQGLAPVQIKIYDILGREVKTLVDEYKPAGEYNVTFDAKGLSGGVYFYRLSAGGNMETRRMILVK